MAVALPSYIAVLDVGSSKVTALVAERGADGVPLFLGGAEVASQGVRRGVIAHATAATAAMRTAIERASLESGRRITGVVVSVSGRQVAGQNARGIVAISPAGREVREADAAGAVRAARDAVAPEPWAEVLHLLPREYAIDGRPRIRNPRGLAASELAAEVHVMRGASTTIRDAVQCLRAAHLVPSDLVAAPLAAWHATAQDWQHAAAGMVVDIGAETTSLALFSDGTLWLSEVLPIGAEDVAEDVARQLDLPVEVAWALLRRAGTCLPETVGTTELLDLMEVGAGSDLLPRQVLASLVSARVRDLAAVLGARLALARQAGIAPAVVVLTGGMSALTGLAAALEHHLGIAVTVGRPGGVRGLPATLCRPAYAVAVGLLVWGAHAQDEGAPAPPPKIVQGTRGLRRAQRLLAESMREVRPVAGGQRATEEVARHGAGAERR